MPYSSLPSFFTCFLLVLGFSVAGQVLLPSPETAFGTQHNFNPAVIKQKNIRKITFEIIDKKDFQIAEDKSLTETYEFNADGRLTRHYYTTVVKTFEKQVSKSVYNRKRRKHIVHTETATDFLYDTISTTYVYKGNNLILKRYHDGLNYYESRYFRYDSSGNLTKELRYRETNNSADKSLFILGNQVLLSADSFQYTRYTSGQIKCLYLNNENRPYKERIINVDSLGRKKSIYENYTAASWIMQEQYFEYAGNKLSSARFEGNANNRVSLRNTYEYDESNELYGEKQYKNDVLIREVSYITDKSNGLLNSFVIRDQINKTMRIVKLRYDLGMIGKASEGKRL
jgi:hypothetical protein